MIRAKNRVWDEVTDLENLKNYDHQPQGPRHVPINHYDAVDSFKERLNEYNIQIVAERAIISPDTFRLIYMADVQPNGKAEEGFNFSVGFMNNNDRSRAFTGICGTHLYANDSEMYISDNSFKTRHTTYVKEMLFERSSYIINWFNEYYMVQSGRINRMKDIKIGDEDLGAMMLKYIREKYTLSSTNIKRLVEQFDNPSMDEFKNAEHTLWMLYNTTAQVFKKIASPLYKLEAMAIFNEFIEERFFKN